MIQSGIFFFLDILNPAEEVYDIANKAKHLFIKVSRNKIIKTADVPRKLLLNPKKIQLYPNFLGMIITLTNTEIKGIMKQKNLIKRNYGKITSQEERSLNFLSPLMTPGLLLIKSAFAPPIKRVLLPFGLSAKMSATDAAIQKYIYGLGTTALII